MRPSTLTAIALALAGAACLSGPRGAQPGDARPADAPVPGPDAAPALAWPPAGADLDIVAAAVADLDHDGLDDLVVASASSTDPALYVIRGDAHGFGRTYVARIAMTEPAVAVDAADLDGDGDVEIAAVSSLSTGRERVSLFLATSAFAWQPAMHKEFDVDTGPGANPWNVPTPAVRIAPLTGKRAAIVVEGKGLATELATLATVDQAGFDAATLTTIAFGTIFDPITPFFRPHAGKGPDLVVGSYFGAYTLADVGDTSVKDAGLEFKATEVRFALCDLDHDGALDIVGGGQNWGFLSNGTAYQYLPGTGQAPGGLLTTFVCGALDGQDGPDLAALSDPAGDPTAGLGSGSRLSLIPNLGLVGDHYENNESMLAVDLPGGATAAGQADALVDGDFDHDGVRDLVVISHDGAVHCYDRRGLGLVVCPSTAP